MSKLNSSQLLLKQNHRGPCPVHFLCLPKSIQSCFKFSTGQTKLVYQLATCELKHILSLIRVSHKCFDVFLVLPNTQLGVLTLHKVCTMYYIGWFGNDSVGSRVKLFKSKCPLPIYQWCDVRKLLCWPSSCLIYKEADPLVITIK